MCRKFSVGKSSVENFPWETEKCPVENFLSQIVMFAVSRKEVDYYTLAAPNLVVGILRPNGKAC